MKLYITGGGTGGHVTPGLAIARYFEKKQPQTTVRFAGSARGIENKLVPREGYPPDTIEIIGMSRSMSPEGHSAQSEGGKAGCLGGQQGEKAAEAGQAGLRDRLRRLCVVRGGTRGTAAQHSDRAARGQRAARQGNADARKGRGPLYSFALNRQRSCSAAEIRSF